MVKKSNILDNRKAFNFSDSDIQRDAMLTFCNSSLFMDDDNKYEISVYKRKLRPHVVKYLDFTTPLKSDDYFTYQHFAAQRILTSMYETDFLFLPEKTLSTEDISEFDEYYSDIRRTSAAVAIPYLEKYAFSHLEDVITVGGKWDIEKLIEFLMDHSYKTLKGSVVKSAQAVTNSTNPKLAARLLLLQLAPDFILESSPMSRYVAGYYGAICSELFKVIIDEFGYGEYDKKHSYLFEKTLEAAELKTHPHYYWQYYLSSSLMLNNYYNMITRNKRHFFRYLGAIFHAETSFINTCEKWADALKVTFGNQFPLQYFHEHVHIDRSHSRMVVKKIIQPAVEIYGQWIIPEIIRGFAEADYLGSVAEDDFCKQVSWVDSAKYYTELHDQIFGKVKNYSSKGKMKSETFIEPKNELSVTHVHDEDELCHINSGEMEFLNGFGKSTYLKSGEGIIIKKGRLHGAIISSDRCDYTIYSIKDSTAWQ